MLICSQQWGHVRYIVAQYNNTRKLGLVMSISTETEKGFTKE